MTSDPSALRRAPARQARQDHKALVSHKGQAGQAGHKGQAGQASHKGAHHPLLLHPKARQVACSLQPG